MIKSIVEFQNGADEDLVGSPQDEIEQMRYFTRQVQNENETHKRCRTNDEKSPIFSRKGYSHDKSSPADFYGDSTKQKKSGFLDMTMHEKVY